ncbi:MAG: O-antigen ligase family protein [Vicinamibacterales bacterium]
MIAAFLCVAAFAFVYFSSRRSLGDGLAALISIGYLYGITRANITGVYSHIIFDVAVLALYAAWLLRPFSSSERQAVHDIRLWVIALVGWPALVFLFWRHQELAIELVGLRANVFFLPFLLIGARLSSGDMRRLALALAVLDIGAVAFGTVQYFVGIEPFFPRNDVTELVYRSKDLVGRTEYRIPSSFTNAHAFGGTLVMTLPFIAGAWLQRRRGSVWISYLWPVAIAAVLLGVFMSAARTHTIPVVVLALAITFSGRLTSLRSLRWVAVSCIVGWTVVLEERLQRFTTLGEADFLTERLWGSINAEAISLMGQYPMGNGLAGGGTNIPYFLQDRAAPPVGLENEYVRITMEQGLPGLFLWALFVLWVVSRGPGRGGYEWARGRRLAWICGSIYLCLGLTGTGMLTGIPQTVLLLLAIGWVGRSEPITGFDTEEGEEEGEEVGVEPRDA